MASYAVNTEAVARARELIESRQYVLDSDWGDVQPKAADENAFLRSHSWEEYAEWHLGLTDGAADETKARYRVRVRRLPSRPSNGADRLPVPGCRVAAQGRRARRARAPAAARRDERVTYAALGDLTYSMYPRTSAAGSEYASPRADSIAARYSLAQAGKS